MSSPKCANAPGGVAEGAEHVRKTDPELQCTADSDGGKVVPSGNRKARRAAGHRGPVATDIALGYAKQWGFSMIPQQIGGERKGLVKFKELSPKEPGEIQEIFNGLECNVAAKAGDDSGGLVEIDIDARECLSWAPKFLPATTWIWGRPSNPNSHWAYATEGQPQLELKDPLAEQGQKPTVVEIRGGRNKLITLPPAKHGASGEDVTFAVRPSIGGPPKVERATLERRAKLLAAAYLLWKYAPADGAHDYLFALGGATRTSGLTDDEAELIGRAVVTRFETSRAEDHIRTVLDGRQGEKGQRLVGWSKLADSWPVNRAQRNRLLKRLREWLDNQDSSGSLANPRVVITPEGNYYLGRADTEVFTERCTSHNLQSILAKQFTGAFDSLGDFNLGRIKQAADTCTRIKYSYVVPDTTFHAESEHSRILTIGVSQDPKLTAVYNTDVQKFLVTLAGDETHAKKLCEWLAATRPDRLTIPCPALALIGANGVGKSLIADAVSRCWGLYQALKGDLLVARFNGALLKCPVVLCDEYLPKGMTGEMFRTLISQSVQSIEKKGIERTTIDGCLRVVLTANSDAILDLGPREKNDAAAIGQRIIRIDIPEERAEACKRAADPLRLAGTSQRLNLDAIAQHVMWMWENIPLTTKSDRWAVEPLNDSLQTVLEGHAAQHEEIWEHVEAEVRRMAEPTSGANKYSGDAPNGGVYVRPEGLIVVPGELAERVSHRSAAELRGALRPFAKNRRFSWKLEGRTANGWLLDSATLPRAVRELLSYPGK